MEVDSLCTALKYSSINNGSNGNKVIKNLINKTIYELRFINDQVITYSQIPQYTSLGIIEGKMHYIYDLDDYDNLFDAGNDMVIDVSGVIPRNIISLIKYGEYRGIPGNCKIKSTINYESGDCTVEIYTTREIFSGEELSVC